MRLEHGSWDLDQLRYYAAGFTPFLNSPRSGLSHDTIYKAKIISERAPEEIKERLRRGETFN